nr:TonB-dependent receptor [Ramlibacter albus]
MVVLDRRDIENLGAFSVADVLKQLPGVVVNTGADGSVEIRMRGMERSATQLLVDGQRQATGRSQLALDQLPPEMVERIEVVRSPSAEFSGATGGTINIVLRQATVRRETSIRLTDNTVWGRHRGQLFFSRTGPVTEPKPATAGQPADDPWAYFLAANATGVLLGSNGHSRVDAPLYATDSESIARYHRHEYSITPRLTGKLARDDTLTLRGFLSRASFGGAVDTGTTSFVGGVATPSASRDTQQQLRHFGTLAADWTHRFEGSKLETTLAANRLRETVDRAGSVVAGPGIGGSSFFVDRRHENVADLKTKLSTTGSPLLRMGGAEIERRSLGIDTDSSATGPFAAEATLQRRILWVQDEWAWGERGTVTAGLRGESIDITTRGPTLGTVHRHIPVVQPSVHLRQPWGTQWQWRANLARTTRNPRVWDLVDRTTPSNGLNSLVNPDTAGNPGLRPEKSWALDTGVERRLGTDGQAGGNLFVRRVQDAIGPLVTQTGGRWLEQRSNVGDATVWGLEFDARTNLGVLGLPREWTLNANFSLLQSRMTSGPNTGQRIPGQPRYTASLNVARPIRRTGGLFGGFTLNVNGTADLMTAPGRTGRNAARTALDLHVGGVVRGLGYWRIGLQNITDAPYRRVRRYDDPTAGTTTSQGELYLTPRAYLTVGTQF